MHTGQRVASRILMLDRAERINYSVCVACYCVCALCTCTRAVVYHAHAIVYVHALPYEILILTC